MGFTLIALVAFRSGEGFGVSAAGQRQARRENYHDQATAPIEPLI
jgi:hypothetical protein